MMKIGKSGILFSLPRLYNGGLDVIRLEMKRNKMINNCGNEGEEIATRPIKKETNKPRSHGPVFTAASVTIDLRSVPR
jgi:hypothetical protein